MTMTADDLTRVPPELTPGRAQTIRILSDALAPRGMGGGYSAGFIQHVYRHWGDTDIEGLWQEYHLVRGTGRVCACTIDAFPAQDLEAHSGGGGVYESEPPTADLWADLSLAYAWLPKRWIGRTVVYLVRGGLSLHAVYEMQHARPQEFAARHRRRVALETFLSDPRPQDALPERWSPWRAMSAVLSGNPLTIEAREAA